MQLRDLLRLSPLGICSHDVITTAIYYHNKCVPRIWYIIVYMMQLQQWHLRSVHIFNLLAIQCIPSLSTPRFTKLQRCKTRSSRNGRVVKCAVLRHGRSWVQALALAIRSSFGLDLGTTNACGYVYWLQIRQSKWLGCHAVYMLIQRWKRQVLHHI